MLRKWSLLLLSFVLLYSVASAQAQNVDYSLRFYGNGENEIDRLKIRIDDIGQSDGEVWPADVGGEDFTIEFWMRASASENQQPSITEGQNINWIYGNIIIDRDRYNQDQDFGISIAGGRVVFGVSGATLEDSRTIAGSSNVLDNQWHHVAIQRRRADGLMEIFVDGVNEARQDGPDGDISYPDSGIPCSDCCVNLSDGPSCNSSDPFMVIGAEKHDADNDSYPSYSGYLDELRISKSRRYTGDSFPIPFSPFITDISTVALYHFNEGNGDTLRDVSGAIGGPSDAVRFLGGNPQGPEWNADSPFNATLPISISSYSAVATNEGNVQISWVTQSERNNYGFEVQRKPASDSDYITLRGSFIAGHGFSNEPKFYTFLDTTVFFGTWTYRLKQMDSDGTTSFPFHVEVKLQSRGPLTFVLMQNYPNPFNASTSIRYDIYAAENITIKIYSIGGEFIKTLAEGFHEVGHYQVVWDGTNHNNRPVSTGVYCYKLQDREASTTEKMLLIK